MTPRCLFVTGMIGLCAVCASARADASPEPAALLRGAEQGRRAIRSGVIELTCEHINAAAGQTTPRTVKVKIVFDGSKRTVDEYQYEFSMAPGPGGDPDHPKAQARLKE